MKYVKLTSKPNTWFKEGTEVYDYCSDPPEHIQRMSLDEWTECDNFNCLVRGIRIADSDYELELFDNYRERCDGELCHCGDFDVEILDEPF